VRKAARSALLAGVLFVAAIAWAPAAQADPDPAVQGQWTPTIPVGVIGIHMVLLHTGKVLMWQQIRDGVGSEAHVFDPSDNSNVDVDLTLPLNIFCSGQTVMPDGRVLITGGDDDSLGLGFGIKDATIFDPDTNQWSSAGQMDVPRWYPTNVQMPNGTTLVLAGHEQPQQIHKELESYNPHTNTWTVLPTTAWRRVGLYPRTVLLPNGRVLVAGKAAMSKLFNPAKNRWRTLDSMNFGGRKEGAVVLLPGLHKVLTAAGLDHGVETNTAEILDTSDPNPDNWQWQYTGSMAIARDNLNLVLLADGTVLAVGGGDRPLELHSDPVKTPELYNPATGTWTTMADQSAERTYHSTAVLLPDGRVLSGGSDSDTPDETTVDIFSPPYLFHGPRPVITSVSDDTLDYGQAFTINSPDLDISRVALVRPGAVTHAHNMDQRYVDLSFSSAAGQISTTAPATGAEAPPGYYMLVIVNSNGVPAVMKWVHLGAY